ncbi:hypothetical protein G3M53_40480 [Streptomyces sp. SID7982]|nr:hypothetical protein [Streptomyces sp. SID7982]
MRRKAHDVMVNGTPMVAVTARDLDGLLATRRQLGSQNARMYRMKDVLAETAEFLETLAAELDGTGPSGVAAPRDPRELAAEIRERIEGMRAVAGRPREALPQDRPRRS